MANVLFASAKEQLLQGGINLSSATVKLIMVDAGAYPNDDNDVFLSDITSGVVATSPALTSKTFTGGTFDSADVTITGVSGATTEDVYLFIDTGTPSTSRLISRHTCTFTPNGSDVTINAPAGGWFSL